MSDPLPAGVACPRCATPAPLGSRFCGACGARLAVEQLTAEVRKQVTVVFCDLAGSTELGERLDPEAMRLVQMRYFAACEGALTRHGGTVEKFIGDAVMCVFGIPAVREDDAVRACRAALEVVEAVETLSLELQEEWDVRLSVRTGVNTGPVVAGDPARGQALVTGDTVNTAARLEQAAQPGQVLLGSLTRRLLGEAALCEPLSGLRVRGKAEPVSAWRLVSLHEGGSGAGGEVPLVGRDDDLATLHHWHARARRDGGLALVTAGAGVGKSRLIAAHLAGVSGRVLQGRCPPYGEGITHWPLAEWLDGLGDAAAAAGGGAERILRAAVGRESGDPSPQEVADAATALADTLTRDGPLLLVLEDAHWAEPAMLELTTRLAGRPAVAVLVSARLEILDAHGDIASGSSDLLLRLGPLAAGAATDLAERVSPELSPGQRAQLVDVAGGNPLAICQLSRHIAEGGDPDALPPGLEGVLQARVERLSPEERAVAERAAVMGREFWEDGITALASAAGGPGAALAGLIRRELVTEGRADGAPGVQSPTLSRVFSAVSRPYSFTSSLIRDAVYRSTPKLRRAELHERLVAVLEAGAAPDEVVAFHLEQAARLRQELRPAEARDLAHRAAARLERAGERAMAREDGQAARALLTRAAALLPTDDPGRSRIEGALSHADVAPVPGGGMDLVPGDVIAGYRVLAHHGRGGMGVVYRAEDLALHRPVALKVIAPSLSADSRFRERFARESRIAARLEHPCVVPVYRAGEERGHLFIAMRFVDGTDLSALVRGGALPPGRAAALVAQVGEALDAAHVKGLVHRDVKPANVLVTGGEDGEGAYLTDFGLTVENGGDGAGLTKTGQWVGTLAYIAPEQIRFGRVDARSDIYALGAVLYQCLTGHLPFPVETELEALGAHLDEPPPRPSEHGAPKAFDRVIARAMAKEPAARYRCAGDLGRAATAAANGERPRLTERNVATGAAAPTSHGSQVRRGATTSRRRMFSIGAAVAVTAAITGVVGAVVLTGGGGDGDGPANPAGRLAGAPVPIPLSPEEIALGDGRAWVQQTGGGNNARLDLASGRVEVFPPAIDLGGGAFPDIAAGDGAVWVTHEAQQGGVTHVDPGTGDAVDRIPLPGARLAAVGDGQVWVATASGLVVSINPDAHRVTGRVALGTEPSDMDLDGSSVWVALPTADRVTRIDRATRRVTARISVGTRPAEIAVGAGGVWVVNADDRTVSRIDPATNEVRGAAISLGKDVQDVVATSTSVWVSAADGTVTRLDPATGLVVGQPLQAGSAPLRLAADGDRVWVASVTDRTVQRIDQETP